MGIRKFLIIAGALTFHGAIKAYADVTVDGSGNIVEQVVIDTNTATDEATAIQKRKSTTYTDNGNGTFTKQQILTKKDVQDKLLTLSVNIREWDNAVQIYSVLIPELINKINKAQADQAALNNWLKSQ